MRLVGLFQIVDKIFPSALLECNSDLHTQTVELRKPNFENLTQKIPK